MCSAMANIDEGSAETVHVQLLHVADATVWPGQAM